eukprot:scaffold127732_cov46-Tisochrysis_lutea.AAC.2
MQSGLVETEHWARGAARETWAHGCGVCGVHATAVLSQERSVMQSGLVEAEHGACGGLRETCAAQSRRWSQGRALPRQVRLRGGTRRHTPVPSSWRWLRRRDAPLCFRQRARHLRSATREGRDASQG